MANNKRQPLRFGKFHHWFGSGWLVQSLTHNKYKILNNTLYIVYVLILWNVLWPESTPNCDTSHDLYIFILSSNEMGFGNVKRNGLRISHLMFLLENLAPFSSCSYFTARGCYFIILSFKILRIFFQKFLNSNLSRFLL